MNGAEAFVETLAASGVTTFFGLPGSTEAPLLEAIRSSGKLRYVLSLHESGTVAMADGYARVTGTPGVVGLHTTVGSLNGASQLYNAARDHTPLVVTAGHKDRTVLAEDGFCALPDLPGVVRDFTKWAWQCLDAASLSADLRRALLHATAPPQGPCFLAVPEDLLAAETSAPVQPWRPLGLSTRPGEEAIEAALDLLSAARRPLLVAGGGAAGAGELVLRLADELGALCTMAEFSDLTVLPYPLASEHHLGLYGEDPAVLEGCDVVLAVGARTFYPFSNRRRPRLPAGARLIAASDDAGSISTVEPAELGLLGEPALTLAALLDGLARRGGGDAGLVAARRSHRDALLARRAAARSARLDSAPAGTPLAIERVAAAIENGLLDGAILVDEAVRSSRHLLALMRPPSGTTVLRSSGGALGWGVPAAVGARIGAPDRPVVAVVGDGSYQFAVQAMWTSVAEHAPVVVVVLDNGGYLAVKQAIEGFLGAGPDERLHPGTLLGGIDHAGIGRGYGADGLDVVEPDELTDALRDGLARQRSLVVRVPVEPAR